MVRGFLKYKSKLKNNLGKYIYLSIFQMSNLWLYANKTHQDHM